MTLEFGVVGSGQQPVQMPDAQALRRVARLAEDAGYDSLWTTDHISFANPILEGVVALAFFAACTERIRIGTGIYLLPLRHPSLVAKQVASIDVLSGGRVILGVGVGGEGEKDFEAVQIPRAERGARTDEALDALRVLWTEREASFHGRFFSFDGITIDPAPEQPVPIWAGGRADKALQRVGRRCQGWLGYFQSPRGFERALAAIHEHAGDAGRDPADITGAMMLPVLLDDDGERARQAMQEHLSTRYGRPFEPHLVERYCLAGTPQECVDRLGEYVAAGARHLVLNPAGHPAAIEEDVQRCAEELIRPLRG